MRHCVLPSHPWLGVALVGFLLVFDSRLPVIQGGGHGQRAWSTLHGSWTLLGDWFNGGSIFLQNFSCTGLGDVRIHEQLKFQIAAGSSLALGPGQRWIQYVTTIEVGDDMMDRIREVSMTLWHEAAVPEEAVEARLAWQTFCIPS